jgi:hypothetical protein
MIRPIEFPGLSESCSKQIYISRPHHSVGNKKKKISMKQKQGTRAEKAVSILCNCITSFQDLRHGTPRSESATSRTRTAKQRRPRRRSSGLCWEASRPAWPVISIYLSSERGSGGGRKRKERFPNPVVMSLHASLLTHPHVWGGPLLTPLHSCRHAKQIQAPPPANHLVVYLSVPKMLPCSAKTRTGRPRIILILISVQPQKPD